MYICEENEQDGFNHVCVNIDQDEQDGINHVLYQDGRGGLNHLYVVSIYQDGQDGQDKVNMNMRMGMIMYIC